jgi:hypothetical protein
MAIAGSCDPRFAPVREEFERNFAVRTRARWPRAAEGMAVGLDVGGQALVDAAYRMLGYQRPERGGSWYA